MRKRVKTRWSDLQHDIQSAFESLDQFRKPVRIAGKLRRLEHGLNHENYLFQIDGEDAPSISQTYGYVLRKCRRDLDDLAYGQRIGRLQMEASVLEALVKEHLDFAVPQFICFAEGASTGRNALIETALCGARLDGISKLPEKRDFAIETIARIAAAVHRIPIARFQFLGGHADARAHVEALRSELPLNTLPSAQQPEPVYTARPARRISGMERRPRRRVCHGCKRRFAILQRRRHRIQP